MHKFLAVAAVGTVALLAGPIQAADIPDYPDIEVPEVDYGLGGSYYLRGSAALNIHHAREATHPDALLPGSHAIDTLGYGYSWGAGFGYETGTGLRFDATMDQVETAGLSITKVAPEPNPGEYTLMLRSTVALANMYYDFGFGEGGLGNGTFGYVGAGAGVAWNHVETNSPVANPVQTGTNVSAAGALMAGVGYDMGTWVADLGYRALYIHEINNAPAASDPENYYEVANNWIHELRGTVRYRFN